MSNFWTNDRVCQTVNDAFVAQSLGARYHQKLREPLPYGEGLTDLRWLDLIVLKCPRLFLLLSQIGCPENIFTAIENNLDDTELPIPDDIPRAWDALALKTTAQKKKFQRLQHSYQVQDLEEGAQLRFAKEDTIPVTPGQRAKGASLPSTFDRVTVKGIQLWRRQFPLYPENGFGEAEFERKFILMMQRVKHMHLTRIWSTYTCSDSGYLLLQPYLSTTLEMFMNEPPKSFKQLPFAHQRLVVTHWIECLTASLAKLHDYGVMHRAIRPSNIYVDEQFQIFLGPYHALGAAADEQSDDAFKKDVYNHAPPEQYSTRHKLARNEGAHANFQGGGRTRRRIATPSLSDNSSSSNRSGTPSTGRSARGNPFSPTANTSITSPTSPSREGTSRFLKRPVTASSAETVRISVSMINYTAPQPQDGWSRTVDTQYFPSDIFSLTTVLISLISFLAALASPGSGTAPSKIHDFLGKTRSNAGRGGAVPDRSFHANLKQAEVWLDKLEDVIGTTKEKPSRKISLTRKNSSAKDQDKEKSQWQGTYTELISLMRHGILKEPDDRWTALEGAMAIESVLQNYNLEPSPCCGATSRESVDYANSRMRSPSPMLASEEDDYDVVSTQGEAYASSLSDTHELPASENVRRRDGQGSSEDELDGPDRFGLSYEHRHVTRDGRRSQAMYDEPVSPVTPVHDRISPAMSHRYDMNGWPIPPDSKQMRRVPHAPVFELPGTQTAGMGVPSKRMLAQHPLYSSRYSQVPVSHELPDTPISPNVDDITAGMRGAHIRRGRHA